MARIPLNHGTVKEDHTGDDLFDLWANTNANFTELYARDAAIFTIGPSGQYATLADVITAIGTPVPTDVTGSHNGVLSVDAYSDTWTLSGSTYDFTNLGVQRQLFLEINGDGKLMPIDGIPDATHVITTSGRDTAVPLSNQPFKLWELPRYVIQFFPGASVTISTQIAFPDKGIYVLRGLGKSATRVRCNVPMTSGRTIRAPSIGILEVTGIGFDKVNDSTAIGQATNTANSSQCCILRLNDVDFEDFSPTEIITGGGYSFQGFFAGIEVSNVSCSSVSYLVNTDCDRLLIKNLQIRQLTGASPAADHQLDIRHSPNHRTKRWFLQNITINSYANGTLQNQWVLQAMTTGATIGRIKEIFVDAWDADQGTIFASGADMQLRLRNVRANDMTFSINSVVIGEGVSKCDGSGAAPSLTLATGAVYKNVNNTKYKSIAYSASITPNANEAGIWIIGAMTGNPTINAPISPQTGQELVVMLTQDAVGGRAPAWNSVFKKSADGAGTANQVGCTRFRYNGTYWIQQGGALTYFT